MVSTGEQAIPIIVNDFRRHRMALQWHARSGTWTACDSVPQLVHGVALIRAEQPNVCIYGQNGQLHLQIGVQPYVLSDHLPLIKSIPSVACFGFRRHFLVESGDGSTLWSHSYWTSQGGDFFVWLATRARDPDWRKRCGERWSEGIDPGVLRLS